MSIPSFDTALVRAIEAGAPPPEARWQALDELFRAGIRRYVSFSPTYPTMYREALSRSAAIDTDSKLLLDVEVYNRCGVGFAAAFLYSLIEKHNVSETEFLVDAGCSLAAFASHEFSDSLDFIGGTPHCKVVSNRNRFVLRDADRGIRS
jgi:hypothetical protein